jgi:DNA polymerase-3 subunit delta
MITLIHGPAELLRAEAVAQIRAQIASDPTLAELNTVVLDGRSANLADIQFACESLPFLAERRLVVVEGLLRRAAAAKARATAGAKAGAKTGAKAGAKGGAGGGEVVGKGLTDPTDPAGGDEGSAEPPQQTTILAYLAQIPETTELVLVEDDIVASAPVLRRLAELQRERKATIIACVPPRKNDLPNWIRERARLKHVNLEPAAVADLVEFVGDDLRQVDQELIKLGDYVAGRSSHGQPAAVTRADVRRLVPATRAANVFDLVEALGSGNLPVAGRLLQHALDVDGEQPLRLLALISRQYRLLMIAKELQTRGTPPAEMARDLGVPDWTVPKLLAQAGHHSYQRLEQALERILAADEAIKTGKLTDREAMDVLLAELGTGAR